MVDAVKSDSESRSADARLRDDLVERLRLDIGVEPHEATLQQWRRATARAIRNRIVACWHQTNRLTREQGLKQVCYLSMEFLMARELENGLMATGLIEECRQALAGYGIDLDDVLAVEPDPALGNGGLGRLAACFLDSTAHLGVPAVGYGIRYEYGMFRQELSQGWQVEHPEDWLNEPNPWEFERPERKYRVRFGGRVNHHGFRAHWLDTEDVFAVAHDTLIPSHGSSTVNTLRLWAAKPIANLDLNAFNQGFFLEALAPRIRSKTVTRLLYPDDSTPEGRELRLRQEHFFVSASLQDLIARFRAGHTGWRRLPEAFAVHLNDTHPALAPAELMRLLVDEHELGWDEAWDLTRRMFFYTNHTLMPEALEVWPAETMQRVVPRHYEIIIEIDRRFRAGLKHRQDIDTAVLPRVAIVAGDGSVNMGRLSVYASGRTNGVSVLHSRLVRERLFPDFAALEPDRFVNITNGISHRLWLFRANPDLAGLIDARLGKDWRRTFDLRDLAQHADDPAFQRELREVKLKNKRRLMDLIARRTGIVVEPSALFDVQVKRIHEYKRQLLNVLGVIRRWQAIKAEPQRDWAPRVVVMAGKAASAYWFAKLVIKLAYDVSQRINHDPETAARLKLVFLPNYNVSLAEEIIPAADLSQQISLAGTEASGTGNMKLALNGALTLGTLDGANVEIAEAVGRDNLFLFGLTVEDVARLRRDGYAPSDVYLSDTGIRNAIDLIAAGEFSPDEPGRFRPVVDALLEGGDQFMVLADFGYYWKAQQQVDVLWHSPGDWSRKAVLNIAGMGRFTSDRSIEEYRRLIWKADVLSSPTDRGVR